MNPNIIIFLVLFIVLGTMYPALQSGTNKRLKTKNGYEVIRMNKIILLAAIAGMVSGSLGLLGGLADPSADKTILIVVCSAIYLMGIFCLYFYYSYRIYYNNEHILYKRFSAKQQVNWDEITDVQMPATFRPGKIRDNHNRVINLKPKMSGLNHFLKFAMQRVPAFSEKFGEILAFNSRL